MEDMTAAWGLSSACRVLSIIAAFAVATTYGCDAAPTTTMAGRVVHVIDGTGLILLVGERRLNVRLEQLDAPEQRQPYGVASRQPLNAVCGGQLAEARVSGKDRNGRLLAQVTCAGIDANAEQVRRGMAWVFDRYNAPESPLYKVQADARGARQGLWASANPVAPWEWRRHPEKIR
jgi:endonuclease YncB( thermonuclease family)